MIFVELFLTFLKIGAFTFGGGYAMIPLIEHEVLNKNWMSLDNIIDFLAVSEGTPGPFSVNIATYVGNRLGGIPGAFFATLGAILPSFIIMLILSTVFDKLRNNVIMNGIITGLKIAVVGLIGAAAISVASTVFLPSGEWRPGVIIAGACITGFSLFLCFKKVNAIIIIGISAGLGIICAFIQQVNIH